SPDEVQTNREDNGVEASRKVVAQVRAAVAREIDRLPADARVVLAVSGGADSFAMLDAVHAARPARIGAVAVFDHRSGAHGRRAVDVVASWATSHGVACVTGEARGAHARATEAMWREERWHFLRGVSRRFAPAIVATGHTWDDQVETVCMRILRGAGARGLAALAADTGVLRPLLALRRATVHAYAEARALPVVDDPTNADRRQLRTRVRLDLLPAFERASPGFAAALWHVGEEAARWRHESEVWARAVPLQRISASEVAVPANTFTHVPPSGLPVLWPALLGRMGVVLDRRGTDRVARFTTTGVSGQEIQLAGGIRVRRTRSGFLVSGDRPMDDGGP
ncbi:MAG: tRNA lysidine(34) synthetase TilS, partial [Gemmatimonadaceae bacterium]|nr:tRNA lysidine(34) synthetase TilS [Gemmatimonadaceae bacterium]